MKTKIITLIALLIAGGLNMYAQDKKILVAYFSWSGNTQYVAEQIAKQTGGTLFRIEPVKPYPTEYTPCTEVAKKEKEDNARPAIKNKVEDWDSYDTVFIGCPVWWWTAPMIINTFTESFDLSRRNPCQDCGTHARRQASERFRSGEPQHGRDYGVAERD